MSSNRGAKKSGGKDKSGGGGSNASSKAVPSSISGARVYVVYFEQRNRHDGPDDGADVLGVYSTVDAANNAMIQSMSNWEGVGEIDEAMRKARADAARGQLVHFEVGEDGNLFEGESLHCWASMMRIDAAPKGV